MKKDVETTLVSFLSKFPDFIRQRHDSLEEFNAQLYNEYLTMVEQKLVSLDYLPGVLDSVLTLLAGNQLTAMSLLVGVPDVDILGTLDKISTKRSPLDAAARTGSRLGAAFAAGESTRLGLRHTITSSLPCPTCISHVALPVSLPSTSKMYCWVWIKLLTWVSVKTA